MRKKDKVAEAPRVPFDVVSKSVQQAIGNAKDYKIFVATDERAFLDYMRALFADKVIYIDAVRAADFSPIHHGNDWTKPVAGDQYMLGEEAVIDCYLLSKTNVMIRTQSNLSLAAAQISPSLPVVDLNQDYRR